MKISVINAHCSEEVINPLVEYLSSVGDGLFCALTAMPMQNAIQLTVQLMDRSIEIGTFTSILPSVLLVPKEVLVEAFSNEVKQCLARKGYSV